MKIKKDNEGTGLICAGLYDKIMAAYAAVRAYVRQQINAAVSTSFKFKGTVATYYDLPECDSTDSTENCPEVGDTYNVIAAYDSPEFGEIPPGTNWAWNGEEWDPLGGSMSDYLLKETAAETYATKESLATGLAGKADRADATLAPIYSQTPTFSEWTFSGIPEGWVINQFGYNDEGTWLLYCQTADDQPWQELAYGEENAVSLAFEGSPSITATRTRTDIVGYTLGSQSDKPLQPAGVYLEKQLDSSGNRTAITMGTRASGSSVGESSVSEGTGTAATGVNAHSEGLNTKALANAAHSEGNSTSANAAVAHVEGDNTTATNRAEHAEGVFNKSNSGTRHSIGIGTSQSNRKNAFEVMSDGKAYLYGVGGYDGTNPVAGKDLKSAIDGKQGTLTFDSAPVQNSGNPVTSGGVYGAATLASIYEGGTPAFSEWAITPSQYEGEVVRVYDNGTGFWSFRWGEFGFEDATVTEGSNSFATGLVSEHFTAARSITNLTSYRLGPTDGPNADKPLQPQSSSMVSAEDISALQALAELDSTTDLQATKDTINTLMKVLKALVPAASAVFMFVLSALGVDSLNTMNPTNLVYTAGEVDELVYTQALSRVEAENGFTEWKCEPSEVNGVAVSIAWSSDEPDVGWYPRLASGGGAAKGSATSVSLTWAAEEWAGGVALTATRTRLRPTPEMEASWDAKASTNDVELVSVFSEWTFSDVASGITLSKPYWYEGSSGKYWIVDFQGSESGSVWVEEPQDATLLTYDRTIDGVYVAFIAARSLVAYHMAGQPTKDMATPDGVAKAIADAEAEARQWAEWFPGGEAKSIADCTGGLKFDWAHADSVNRTVPVLPFCDTGTATDDNSDTAGVVVIPPYVETNGVRYAVVGVADGFVLDTNTALTSVVAPTTVTAIGEYAFESCSALASVSLPAVTDVGGYAFRDCEELSSVTLPAATIIVEGAFISCSVLASISLPAATDIGDSVFYNCFSLTSVSLPAATNIGSSAFVDCPALASVDFGPTARQPVPALGIDAFPTLSGHTCRIIVPDNLYTNWIADPDWAALTSMGYQFTKHGGTYLKDANGIYWELTVGTDGVLGTTAATNTANQVSQ